MTRYLTIGYGEQAGYDRTPASLRAAAHANDTALVEAGAEIGTMANPVCVRNPQGQGARTEPGAYSTSAMPVAGFALIEADSLEDAIAKVAGSPCAVADGVIEVWEVGG